MIRPCRLLGLILPALLTPISPVSAQAPPPPEAPADLEINPITAESLGLTLIPPAGAIIVTENTADGKPSVSITDGGRTPTWRIRIQPLESNLPNPSPQSIAAEHLRSLQASPAFSQLLVDRDVRFGGVLSRLFFVEQNVNDSKQVTGWMIMPRTDNTFLVFSIVTFPENLQGLLTTLDRSFSTIILRDHDTKNLEKRLQLDAGRALLERFNREKVTPVLGTRQWYRVYQPAAADGETEIGCYSVEVLEGKCGNVDETRDERSYTAGEHALGLLIRVHGRVVIDASRNIYIDSLGLYWMAWDRSEERWSILTTKRQGDAEITEAETGVMSPRITAEAGARLTVIQGAKVGYRRDPFEWTVPDAYLTQAEKWIISYLMPHDVTTETPYAFYCYDSQQAKLSRRTDRWMPDPANKGQWLLASRLSADLPEFLASFDARGHMIRQERPNGSTTVPISVDDLKKLWAAKKLTFGKVGSR